MQYVLGVDLGTSGVKTLLFRTDGTWTAEASAPLSVSRPADGWSEQDPEAWVEAVQDTFTQLKEKAPDAWSSTAGISFSGQMHGLVLLDEEDQPLRPAILWNDTRTTPQCRRIESVIGKGELLDAVQNKALEGFTLPKLLWVQEEEPELFARAASFVLPKDYVRGRLTGTMQMEWSDAAGTLLFDHHQKAWREDILKALDVPVSLLPPLLPPTAAAGTMLPELAETWGLSEDVQLFAGGADNACGAVGSGVLQPGTTMCSIGTSGVMLSYADAVPEKVDGSLHVFHHADPDAFYTMGVTLAAGSSLSWFRDQFWPETSFEDMMDAAASRPAGAGGLLFTPYISGERTPYAEASLRGSFIGADASHERADFARAVVEGITFSLRDCLELIHQAGSDVKEIVSIGGGAKSSFWLQLQADIFQVPIVQLEQEQGPGLGAAVIAASGVLNEPLQQTADAFVKRKHTVHPSPEQSRQYDDLYKLYKQVYEATAPLTTSLQKFRSNA
ncbi:xylulokinase [Alkalicoccus chagannorensis]|uniref:xylulokinase n=1 Tax=Alkalicoccus chagannorensis TaxID=427072 RepID=UPI000402F220|nr:xylulokinase [Alkalicoccus chagannorensis]